MNLMYSCRRVAELLSQNLDEPLGPIDRLRLRLHLSMCSNCSNVERQLIAVKALSTDLFSSGPEPGGDDGQSTKK
jgi:predicted anti-sigma-YlaC factor YlaD